MENFKITFFLLFTLFFGSQSLKAQVVMSNSNQNFLYIGVDNPLEIAVQNEPLEALRVEATGYGTTITGNNGFYTVRATTPGDVHISVFIEKNGKNTLICQYPFWVKGIPDPFATLNGQDSKGSMSATAFKKYDEVLLLMKNVDFELTCSVQGFEFTMHRPGEAPVSVFVQGSKLNEKALKLRDLAVSGTVYYFDNIKARCPGDVAGRHIKGMVWRIL